MNKVSGFVGGLSKPKEDVINHNYGCFQYSNQDPETIYLGMIITHSLNITTERNNLIKERLSKRIPNLFLQKYKRVSYHLEEIK